MVLTVVVLFVLAWFFCFAAGRIHQWGVSYCRHHRIQVVDGVWRGSRGRNHLGDVLRYNAAAAALPVCGALVFLQKAGVHHSASVPILYGAVAMLAAVILATAFKGGVIGAATQRGQ